MVFEFTSSPFLLAATIKTYVTEYIVAQIAVVASAICAEENENSYEQGKNCLRLRKVLGINWDIEKDLFVFDFDEIVQLAKDLKFTKRNLLKINATLFDPLGLISPITLQGKLLFKLLL